MNFRKYIKEVTFDRVILFIFLIINFGFYYQQFLFLVKPSYVLLIIAFVRKVLIEKKFFYYDYLKIVILFSVFAFISIFWAYNQEQTLESIIILFKTVFLSIMVISLCDTPKNARFALFTLGLASLIYTGMYISFFDISELGSGRFSSFVTVDSEIEIPNTNVVGMLGSFSFAYFFYMFILKKNKAFLLMATVAFVFVFILGSRKSILNLFASVLFIYPVVKTKFRIILFAFVGGLIVLVINFLPNDYLSFIFDRFTYMSTNNTFDVADQQRVDMIKNGLNYIGNNPIFGYGYYNFAELFKRDSGMYLYSHNNFLETIVGLGLIGTIIYYSTFYVSLKRLKLSKYFSFSTLIIALFILNMFNHFFIVVSNDRFNWVQIAVLFANTKYIFMYKQLLIKKNENRIPG